MKAGVNRRTFAIGLATAGATAAGALTLNWALAGRGKFKVVVIGGGPAGASVARQVKRQSEKSDVLLIEKNDRYVSCFFSNHYIGGLRSFQSLTHYYKGLRQEGIGVLHRTVSKIDAKKKILTVGRSNQAIPYDILVVAPGISIDFGSVPGYSKDASKVMPHAWQGGTQTKILRRRLEEMKNGDTVVIAPPKMPYRCPPGPYERAALIAHYLKTNKPRSKLFILEPKFSFSKQPVFEEAFARYYKDTIELYLSNDIDDYAISRVDPRTGEIETNAGLKVKADVANIIPAQKAGEIALSSGLADPDWCPVRPASFQSLLSDDIYVLGDAAIADAMPKSAFSAHNQAKLVAAHIVARLNESRMAESQLRNTCWSMLAPNDSVKIGADYQPGEINGRQQLVPEGSFVSRPGEKPDVRQQNYADSVAWYNTLTTDVYPKSQR